MVLPSASSILLNGNNSGQVFNNPYKKAETDQIASLEKHVKMVWKLRLDTKIRILAERKRERQRDGLATIKN